MSFKHSLGYASEDGAKQAELALLATLSIPAKESRVHELSMCWFLEFKTDEALDEETQAFLVEKLKPSASLPVFNETDKQAELERIKALTNDESHVREQALRLSGVYLQAQRGEIVELEASKIDEEDGETAAECYKQLEVIGDEIVRLGAELVAESKEVSCHGLGNAYLLGGSSTATHRVFVDGEQAHISQGATFGLTSDDIEMLITVLRGIKADKNVPHSFSNVNARYNFFYQPGGGNNAFTIKHMTSMHTIGMDTRSASKLLNALTGKTEHLTRIGRGGSPLVQSTRRKVWVKIQEVNNPPSALFDTSVAYSSDALPEWFVHLQSIVEDNTFTSMTINLDKTRYHITLAQEEDTIPKLEFKECD